jgi:hypothetical protein
MELTKPNAPTCAAGAAERQKSGTWHRCRPAQTEIWVENLQHRIAQLPEIVKTRGVGRLAGHACLTREVCDGQALSLEQEMRPPWRGGLTIS